MRAGAWGARILVRACCTAMTRTRHRHWPSGWTGSIPRGATSNPPCAPRRLNRPRRAGAGVDLGHAIQRLAAEGLLIKGGGHRMAAGLTVARNQLDAAMNRLSELLARQGAGAAGPGDLRLDGLLMPAAATPELVNRIEEAGPFGAGAPGPRYVFADMAIRFAKRVGDSHLKLSFSDGTGPTLDAIAFGAFDGPLGPALEQHGGARYHLAGRLDINTWGGRQSVQLRLEDAARTE